MDIDHIKTETINVIPNDAYASASTLSFADVVELEVTETVSVEIFDKYSNPVIEEQPIVLNIVGNTI